MEIVRGWMSVHRSDDGGRRWPSVWASRSERVDDGARPARSRRRVLRGSLHRRRRRAVEWCERGLLARIHRLTLGRLRKEIEAVSPADFVRFLLRWQHVQPGTQLHGRDGVREVIRQLEGLELPGPAWERDVLPARIADYDPADLEHLCLAGEVAWGRLRLAPPAADEPDEPAPRTPPRGADASGAARLRAAPGPRRARSSPPRHQ